MHLNTQIMILNHLKILHLIKVIFLKKLKHLFLLLCAKLAAVGIDGMVLEWIKFFLNNRKQRVVMGDCLTEWVEVKSGVPQGSVLGPILFLIFINDLPDKIINQCRLYADDNKVIAPICSKDDSLKFQDDIDMLDEWSDKWS